jgi:hypothetical protein
MKYNCPVCGFDGLTEEPYDKHGCASFDICPSCGTEYGNTDFNVSHKELRKKWVENGCKWYSKSKSKIDEKPADWDPHQQLQKAGLIDEEMSQLLHTRKR